jgi:hypothetical protein
VRLLQPQAVDPDMLDELARKKLNYISPDELVMPLKATPGIAPSRAQEASRTQRDEPAQ